MYGKILEFHRKIADAVSVSWLYSHILFSDIEACLSQDCAPQCLIFKENVLTEAAKERQCLGGPRETEKSVLFLGSISHCKGSFIDLHVL